LNDQNADVEQGCCQLADAPIHAVQKAIEEKSISPWAASMKQIAKSDLIKIKAKAVLLSNVGQAT
jgi:hypothetical protein